ncbi:peptidase [Roseibium sp. TrichSKD4]|nr:peptidase [Roseibium sp. TrichSKD4]
MFSIVMMIYYDVILALISFSGLVLFSFLRILLYGPLRRYTAEEVSCKADADGRMLQAVEGIFSVKVFDVVNPLSNLWARSLNQSLKARRKKENYRITFDTLSQAVLHAEQLLVVAWAGYRIINGEATVGAAYAYIQYKNIFGDNFIRIFNTLLERNIALVHIDRMADIVQTKPDIDHSKNVLPTPFLSLSCRDLAISPLGSLDVILENVTLTIKQGQTAVFIGKTGAGKSTLLSALVGIIPTAAGSIQVNGKDVEEKSIPLIRNHVATVTPKDTLFSGTIQENITSFHGFVDDQRYAKAIDIARISNRIKELDHGDKTEFSIARHILSTGEIQRLLIARAIYRAPDILYLDEFTANLDVDTANDIWDDIKKLPCIKLVASHQKNIRDSADQIFELDNGALKVVKAA